VYQRTGWLLFVLSSFLYDYNFYRTLRSHNMLQEINVRNIYYQFLLCYLYLLLIIASTYFSYNFWPSSGSKRFIEVYILCCNVRRRNQYSSWESYVAVVSRNSDAGRVTQSVCRSVATVENLQTEIYVFIHIYFTYCIIVGV